MLPIENIQSLTHFPLGQLFTINSALFSRKFALLVIFIHMCFWFQALQAFQRVNFCFPLKTFKFLHTFLTDNRSRFFPHSHIQQNASEFLSKTSPRSLFLANIFRRLSFILGPSLPPGKTFQSMKYNLLCSPPQTTSKRPGNIHKSTKRKIRERRATRCLHYVTVRGE